MSIRAEAMERGGPRRTRRPQDLVFSLFGEYLLGRHAPVWVGSLIELLEPFEMSPNAVRTVVSRMSRKGWLKSERKGRRSFYDLTRRGRKLLEEGAERIYHPPRDEAWDGSWQLIAYSIPENERHRRDQLRVRLAWLGCGSLGNGLWISPHPIAEAVREIAEELELTDHLEVFRAEHLGFSDVDRMVSQAWDLPDINRCYAVFIRRFNRPFVQARKALENGGLDPRDAYARRFELIHAYRDFPLIDPYLPRMLLPSVWAGDCVAWLFEKYHDLLTEPADRYVDRVLAAAAEEDAT
jgi:phenylacetic acid degradation operon negative regulatory protein